MAADTFRKFNSFPEALGRKVHNLNADVIKVVLSNTAVLATNAVLADITQIANGNGYTTGGTVSSGNAYSQSSGTGKFTSGDVLFTASGSMGPFRYAVMYNDTATNDELIGWIDYGAAITLTVGDTFLVDFNAADGVLTIT